MKDAFLIGERIYLRPLERDDLGTCKAFINDPDVWATLDTCTPKTMANEEAWLASLTGNTSTIAFGIALKESDRLIGATDFRGIHPMNRSATFGIVIGAKDQWRKGYGTEATRLMVTYAFATLNLNRITLHVYATNPAGIRAYEKAGFVREGTLRQDVYRNGRYIDVHVMGILREEWKE